jgi:hypothetical protein
MSMDPLSTGAYLTSHVHISPGVWQSSAFVRAGQKSASLPKIVAQEVKMRVLTTMCFHLDIIRSVGAPLLEGTRDYAYGKEAPDVDPAGTHRVVSAGDELCRVLDAMDEDMMSAHKMLVKQGVQVNSWKEKSKRQSVSRWNSVHEMISVLTHRMQRLGATS